MKAKTKQNAVPAKLLKNSIFLRKIRVSPVLNIDILISKDGKLFEIQDGGVINNCTLKKIDAKSTLEFQLFFNYQNSTRNVFYLIKSGKYLNIIQRKTTLELITCYENVQSIKILSNSGHPSIEIRLLDSSTIVTNLINDENSTENAPFEEPDDQIVKKAKELLHEEKVKCQESFDSYANLYQNVCDELKTAPKHLRSENQLEKVILVPYANNWKRVHNRKFILGLPILNATSQRPITALNITATVFCEELTDFEYSSCLYRCAEDFHSVEELKQKLQNLENEEENYTDLHRDPKFEEEWTVSENGNLHGEESGIVIVTLDVKLLLDKALNLQKDVFTFNCFVNYHVNDEKSVQHDLQLHFGDVQITQKELFSTELWINFKHECLIDLLAVTTSTSSVHLSFVYSCEPLKETEIQDFLVKNFGFNYIPIKTSENLIETTFFEVIPMNESFISSSLLYQNEGILKGMVVRVQKSSLTTFNVKIYGNETQMVSLVKTFISEFDEKCKITMRENAVEKEKLIQNLRYSLIDEIQHIVGTEKDKNAFEKFLTIQSSKEIQSDIACERLLTTNACEK